MSSITEWQKLRHHTRLSVVKKSVEKQLTDRDWKKSSMKETLKNSVS